VGGEKPPVGIGRGSYSIANRLAAGRPPDGPAPNAGMIGVRQVTPHGRLNETIRRFPNALRAPTPSRRSDCGAVTLIRRLCARSSDYDREVPCNWTRGWFMLVQPEGIESAGFLNERYFMYADETDFAGG
jgi:GT2 family glycosyltransferase